MQNIQVTGENYEVTGPKKWGADLVGWIRMFCFIFMFTGEMIISSLGGINSMPDIVKDAHGYVQENKLKFGMMAFLLGSMIQAQLLQSGAFEIYLNGKLEYSKLKMNRMPDIDTVELLLRTNGVHFK